MKFSKFLVLLAGLVGITAFFLPLLPVKAGGSEEVLSAFQIVTGADGVQEAIDGAIAESAKAYVDKTNSAEASNLAKEALAKVKGVMLMLFVPAILLAILGIAALIRKQFGRLGGVGALLLGIIGLAFWAVLNQAANEAATAASQLSKGIGMHMLLGAGGLGVLGGLLALIKPDRKEAKSAF